MAIVECPFESESELEGWAIQNLTQFLGRCTILGKIQIVTPAGKLSIPDGFAFNFTTREWFVIEAELLVHGVWPHIAEQITRFVVALQNPDTLRKIRDRLFEQLLASGDAVRVSETLGIGVDRLLQKIELFVEAIQPSIVIFIDDANQDLTDFAHALDIPTKIFRIRKFLVDGRAEYYSPDRSAPILETLPESKASEGNQDVDVIEQLGGGVLVSGQGRFKCYRLDDGRVVHIKRSKFHEKNSYYWYGINSNSLEQAYEMGVTDFIFVMGIWGFVVVPIDVVKQFCQSTKVSRNSDGSIRHYHVLISQEPEPELFFSSDVPRIDLSAGAHQFQ